MRTRTCMPTRRLFASSTGRRFKFPLTMLFKASECPLVARRLYLLSRREYAMVLLDQVLCRSAVATRAACLVSKTRTFG